MDNTNTEATIERSPVGLRLGAQALAAEIAEAVFKDEQPEAGGCDIGAGMFGPNFSALIRKIATEYLARPAAEATLNILSRKESRFRVPSIDSPHRKFWEHLKAGGRVWRDDRINGVKEWLDLERLGGDANEINRYGHKDLSLTGPEIDVTLPLYDSDGYEHHFVTRSTREIVTKRSGLFCVWDARTGSCLRSGAEGYYLGNTPLSDEEMERRKQEGARILTEIRAAADT